MSRLEFDSVEDLMRHADELRAGQRTAKAGDRGHLHYNEQGYWVRCYHKCRSWTRIAMIVLVTDVICELVTFLPIHRMFEALGWIH